jgi:hypothetical protein
MQRDDGDGEEERKLLSANNKEELVEKKDVATSHRPSNDENRLERLSSRESALPSAPIHVYENPLYALSVVEGRDSSLHVDPSSQSGELAASIAPEQNSSNDNVPSSINTPAQTRTNSSERVDNVFVRLKCTDCSTDKKGDDWV